MGGLRGEPVLVSGEELETAREVGLRLGAAGDAAGVPGVEVGGQRHLPSGLDSHPPDQPAQLGALVVRHPAQRSRRGVGFTGPAQGPMTVIRTVGRRSATSARSAASSRSTSRSTTSIAS